jgi:hypothetical protein
VRAVAPKRLKRRIYAAHRTGAGKTPAVEAMLGVLADAVAAREPLAKTA